MTAAAAPPTPPPAPAATFFLGRAEEGRAVLLSARAGRSVVLVGPTGYGKSALLSELAPTLDTLALTLRIPRAAPFGTFLADLAAALLAGGVSLPGGDLAGWKKAHAGNDLKARSLVVALRDYRATGATPPVLLVDDATGLTQSMVPALLALAEHAAVVCACQPETVRKAGLMRWWNKCDRVDLGPLDRAQARPGGRSDNPLRHRRREHGGVQKPCAEPGRRRAGRAGTASAVRQHPRSGEQC